jgi:hypothetical protein
MRSRPGLFFIGIVVVGIAGLVLTMARDRRGFDYTLNTRTTVTLKPDHVACRRSVKPKAGGLNALRFFIDTQGRPGPPLNISVFRGYTRPNIVATGYLRGGYRGRRSEQIVHIHGSAAGAYALSACVDNAGTTPIVFWPRPPFRAKKHSEQRGITGFQEISLSLIREPKRSMLSLLPTAFSRAELFRPSWVHSWMYWGMVALVILLVPFLLLRALLAVEREEPEDDLGARV